MIQGYIMDVTRTQNHKIKIFQNKTHFNKNQMSGHQSTADMVNNELDQFQALMNPTVDMLMADLNPNPDFSGAPDIHDSLENNTQSNIGDFGGHGNTAI